MVSDTPFYPRFFKRRLKLTRREVCGERVSQVITFLSGLSSSVSPARACSRMVSSTKAYPRSQCRSEGNLAQMIAWSVLNINILSEQQANRKLRSHSATIFYRSVCQTPLSRQSCKISAPTDQETTENSWSTCVLARLCSRFDLTLCKILLPLPSTSWLWIKCVISDGDTGPSLGSTSSRRLLILSLRVAVQS